VILRRCRERIELAREMVDEVALELGTHVETAQPTGVAIERSLCGEREGERLAEIHMARTPSFKSTSHRYYVPAAVPSAKKWAPR
jgi:hypothetical protein